MLNITETDASMLNSLSESQMMTCNIENVDYQHMHLQIKRTNIRQTWKSSFEFDDICIGNSS